MKNRLMIGLMFPCSNSIIKQESRESDDDQDEDDNSASIEAKHTTR